MHKLSMIKIKNYKSIIFEEVKLDDFTPLIGYNNAGKTNILSAIEWLLKKSSLKTKDFFNLEQGIEIEGVISGITSEILEKINSLHQESIKKYIKNSTLEIKRTQESPGVSAGKISLEVKDSETGEWKKNPTGIDNALKYLFPEPILINAMENAEEDISKSKTTTTIGKLIGEIIGPIETKYTSEIDSIMGGLKELLSAEGDKRAPELEKFDHEANEKLSSILPNLKVKLHVPTPELKEVFKTGTLKVYEDDIVNGKDIEVLGNGSQRLIQMALIRQLAEVKKQEGDSKARTLLLIDEPELYLHPQAIEQLRIALKTLSKEGYQIIFSTHSAQMVISEDITSAILVRKSLEKGTHIRKRLDDAIKEVIPTAGSQLEMIFSLTNSNQVLFSEKVLLTEGKTELRILPKLYEIFFNTTISADKCALIRQGGVTNTHKTKKILEAIDIPSKAIVDLDYAFSQAIKDGYLTMEDEDIKYCLNKLKVLEETTDITLNKHTNLPQKNNKVTAAKAFAILAEQEDAKVWINNLHKKLKEENIWLWKNGAIEEELGIEGKNESIWAQFIYKLKSEDKRILIKNYEEVEELFNWIRS